MKVSGTVHEVSDDIESFIYVLLWVAARYAPNTLSPEERFKFLAYFDYDPIAPWTKRLDLCEQGALGIKRVKLTTLPFRKVLAVLMEQLRRHGDEELTFQTEIMTDEEAKGIKERLLTHNWMEDVLEEMLQKEGWQKIKTDSAVRHPVAQDPSKEFEFSRRRKSRIDEYQVQKKNKHMRLNEAQENGVMIDELEEEEQDEDEGDEEEDEDDDDDENEYDDD